MQVRNAPTRLMKKLGYGKEYAYNPDYQHPVANECLPPNLAQHSSLSPHPDQHILRSVDAEARTRNWNDERLAEWEEVVGHPWRGREDKK